jgi:hypothetical protein
MVMGLGEWSLRTSLATRTLTAGLARRGVELAGGGYQRCAIHRWAMDGATARATARFGPFTTPVVFDAVCMYDGAELVSQIPKGTTQLPEGDYTADILLGMVDG